jgi:HD-GYP domain-containing protein (c-di-GMP phosphodiesterase class II)
MTARADRPWSTLDRLVTALQASRQPAESMAHAVEAVHRGVGADLTFSFSESSRRVGSVHSRTALQFPHFVEFATGLLAKQTSPCNDVLWSNPAPVRAESAASPRSALMVRLGKSHAWIAALSFSDERQLHAADLMLAQFVRRVTLSHNQHLKTRLKDVLLSLVRCLTATIEAKDPYTAGHSERVGRIGMLIGRRLGLSAHEVSNIFLAGLIHDIGKIGVEDAVLQKVGRLSADEFAHVREHVTIGDRIIANVKEFSILRPGVRNHHERFDGNGYPDGLKGHDIPLLARILTVADTCDAMMSPRRYRPAYTPPSIDKVFEHEAGKQFDPELVECFMHCRQAIYPPIYQRGIHDSATHAIGQMIETLGEDV